uniref:Uncharacterized protein n=1 Tax=Anopheles funestus TaxID=62324 RepID=A0A4Y0BGI8_ANOFN
MSRWDRRNDEGQYNQRQRNEIKPTSNRPRLSRSRSPSDSSDSRSHSRSRSRSPAIDNPQHRAPSYKEDRYDQRNHHRRHHQEEEERRRRQEALDSRGRTGPNGTRGPGPGGEIFSLHLSTVTITPSRPVSVRPNTPTVTL